MDELVMKVKKANGKIVDFDKQKIITAILKASEDLNIDVSSQVLNRIATDIEKELVGVKNIKTSYISTLVENKLMKNYPEIAKAYIIKHNEKEQERLYNTEIAKQFRKKLEGSNIENQNANQDERTFAGRMNEASRVFLKDHALNELVSKKTRDNHNNNEIYIHDLDNYSIGTHNCLSLPIDKLLEKGYVTRNGDSRRPHSIDAAIQLIVGMMQIQSIEQFGGVSATHLDWSMIPFIRHSFWKFYRDGMNYINNKKIPQKDEKFIENTSIEDKSYYRDEKASNYAMDLTKRELYQGFESFYHECNQLGVRSGGQLPFSSINYGTCTLKEGQMCIEALLDACMDGMGKLHKTYIFPCGIFQVMKGVNDKKGTPNYYLFRKALKCTSLRIYPNYANCDWSIDKEGLQKDREYKRNLINDLSDEKQKKLATYLKNNKDIANKYSLSVENNKINVLDRPLPEEIMSTMGCIDEKETITVKIDGKVQTMTIKEFYEFCESQK